MLFLATFMAILWGLGWIATWLCILGVWAWISEAILWIDCAVELCLIWLPALVTGFLRVLGDFAHKMLDSGSFLHIFARKCLFLRAFYRQLLHTPDFVPTFICTNTIIHETYPQIYRRVVDKVYLSTGYCFVSITLRLFSRLGMIASFLSLIYRVREVYL